MPYWFNRASIAQQSSDILYPICVLFEANASNPDTGVLYEYDDQYFLPNIEVVTEQFNAWLDEMKGFPYNWNVGTVLFYVVSTPTHCPSLVDDLEPLYLRIKHGFPRKYWTRGLNYVKGNIPDLIMRGILLETMVNYLMIHPHYHYQVQFII
jgi:hypothetical protein